MWLPTDGVRDQGAPLVPGNRRVLDSQIVRTLHDLNRAFLAVILRAEGPDPAGRTGAFGAAGLLASLPPQALTVAAESPFPLFDLRFDDAAFWRRVVGGGHGAVPAAAPLAAFCRLAVFLTWHLVRARDQAAPLALGVAPAVVDVWRGLPLTALDGVAESVAPFVGARWPGHTGFWLALTEAAATGNVQQLTAVRLLGLQLLAADSLPKRQSGGPKRP